jgi:hypothetical protein
VVAGFCTAGAVLACWEQPSTPRDRRAKGTATIILMIIETPRWGLQFYRIKKPANVS